MTSVIKNSVDSAETSAKAHASLAAALNQIGVSAKSQVPAIDKFAQRQAQFGVSANVAVTGLARLVELTGSTRKAMEGYTAALEISKATGKDFNTVSLAVGKALNGQTTALARYIGKIPKGTTNLELLNEVSQKYGGQAEANTLATDRLGAELSNLEVIIGNALLPTIDKIATKLADWLGKSKNQERVQRDVNKAVSDATTIFGEAKTVIDGIDRVTGSFKHTLELLLALKVASTVAGWTGAFAKLAGPAGIGAADAEATGLLATMGSLSALGPIVLTVAVAVNDIRDPKSILKRLDKLTNAPNSVIDALKNNPATSGIGAILDLAKTGRKAAGGGKNQGSPALQLQLGDHSDTSLRRGSVGTSGPILNTPPTPGKSLTPQQRNTFFDNSVARILLRGGLGGINQQLAAIKKASALITARIAATKDATRKLNLEDQLLQLASQTRSLNQEKAANAVAAAQKRQEARQKAAEARDAARQKRLEKLTASEFFTLGLGSTGDTRTPLKGTLKKHLGTLSQAVKGTFLDTSKTRNQLAGIRKVLSESIVPSDVRSKIRDLLDGIRQELNQGASKLGNQTKFKHASTSALIAGLGLDPKQARALRQRLAQVGAKGTIPGGSAQFASGTGVVIHNDVYLDGSKISKNTTSHQVKAGKRRTTARRG